MSGIYIHIPFCKQACHYCNFHFSTSLNKKDEVIDAICKEIITRKEYLTEKKLESIYFGGGTPSLLKEADFVKIFDTISKYFEFDVGTEITLEANPDDLTPTMLGMLKSNQVNRLSIGIQSFFDEDLQFYNRAHTGAEAHKSIQLSQEAGFENITVDLIYGSPTTTDAMWMQNIASALEFNIPHISCYCLTVEEKTPLHHFIKTGKVRDVSDKQAVRQFDLLVEELESNDYIHYEISNFAQKDNFAIHNSNYWNQKTYLGIGPSAHSFNGFSRQWNVANNVKYLEGINSGNLFFEIEELTTNQVYNEYILTSLRTLWGVNEKMIKSLGDSIQDHFNREIQKIDPTYLIHEKGAYRLSKEGKHFADRIASDLFR